MLEMPLNGPTNILQLGVYDASSEAEEHHGNPANVPRPGYYVSYQPESTLLIYKAQRPLNNKDLI